MITGFLGSGKTTFIKKYARYLMEQGENIGILENDFGAVNVDMMLLQDVMGDQCELEMVAGGCDYDCHKRRFKTKLISMGMCGYDRVLVEPSGIYDVDEFFDVLHEEPLDRWYEIGNVIAIVDASLEPVMSEQAEYLLASQISRAGQVVLSRSENVTTKKIQETIQHLNQALKQFQCKRTISDNVFYKDWEQMEETDFAKISSSGYTDDFMTKLRFEQSDVFDSLYFMNTALPEEQLLDAVKDIFVDKSCGDVFRVKGFLRGKENPWMELNATQKEIALRPIPQGQEVLIVIGEHLVEDRINAHLQKKE